MKNIAAVLMALAIMLPVSSCGTGKSAQKKSDGMSAKPTEAVQGQIPITLVIGNTVLEAYLDDSVPGRSLAAQLPLTVTLNDSDNDFCGDRIDIEYSASDVRYGYKNGDLCLWTPARNFVIFVSDEETSSATGDLVRFGHITSPQSMLDTLSGQLNVTIALKEI